MDGRGKMICNMAKKSNSESNETVEFTNHVRFLRESKSPLFSATSSNAVTSTNKCKCKSTSTLGK